MTSDPGPLFPVNPDGPARAAMTALLDDSGTRVLLTWQPQLVPGTPTSAGSWELPGGLVEDGEDPAVAAARELAEQTGYWPGLLEHVVTFEPVIGLASAPHHVFIGRGSDHLVDPVPTVLTPRWDWIPLDGVPALIAAGRVRGCGTLIALLHLLAISRPQHSPPPPPHRLDPIRLARLRRRSRRPR
jgi:8-oxo-dGTP pyrophosphatase MutT (NUDIX family)